MKILCIGAGSIGRRHISNLLALGHHLVVADPYAAPVPDVLWYTDWDKALAERGDAAGCIIASPTGAHCDQLLSCLERNIPIFCEKPIVSVADYIDYSADDWRPVGRLDKCVVNFQYLFHPSMPAVERAARKYGEIAFRGQDDLMDRYGNDVEGVMVAHPVATALRLFGPATSVHLCSDGVVLDGYITHHKGNTSHYNFNMGHGPRESWAGAGDTSVALTADTSMYFDCLGAWTKWIEGGERDPRLASLAEGLAVTDVLSQVQRVKEMR